MGNRILYAIGIFFLLFILFFPLDFLGDFQRNISSFLFEEPVRVFAHSVMKKEHLRIDFSSDSISMFILVGLLMGISVILSLLVRKKYREAILCFAKETVTLYLIVVLVKYGLDKVFKTQFYLPEPNILYSRFGNLDKDILFWSTMGTSRFYSIFTGLLELFTAGMILFNRTRMLGLLISLGIFINILGINLGFDISVKLFSLVLLLMTLFVLKDDWMALYRFFILRKETEKKEVTASYSLARPFMVGFKTAFLGLSVAVIVYPYLDSGNYNDDKEERPFFHGVFRNMNDQSAIQYIFFHRQNYLILMDKNEKMQDFHYTVVSPHQLRLEDYTGKKINTEIHYQKQDSLMILNIEKEAIKARELNWKKMNALRPLFHMTVEGTK